MLFPTGARTPLEHRPYVVYVLLAANTLVHLVLFSIWIVSGEHYVEVLRFLGFVPDAPSILTFVAHGFVHAGWIHFIGNMLYLWIFGAILEDRVGHTCFGLLYFTAMICGALIHGSQVSSSQYATPLVGASGAIFGVYGAFLIIAPLTEIRLVGCILIFPLRVYVAAFWLIPFWFLINFLGATLSPEQGSATGYWAHLGGFFAGLPFGILSRIWVAREQRAEKEPPPAIDSPAAMLARYREGIHSFIIAGDFDSAWTAWQNMQADFPKALLSIEDQFALARLAEKREIYDAAALAYRILANSNHADEIRARAAVHMGGLYLDRLGDKDRAALIFQKVISKFPRTDAVRDAEQRLEEIFGRSGLAGT